MKKYPKYKKYRGGNSPRFSSHDLILWLLNAWRRKKIGSVFSSFCLWENQNFSGKFYFLKKPTFNGCLCECFLTFSLLLLYDIYLCLYCYFVLSSLQRLRILLICSLMLLEIPDLLDMGFVQNGENLIVCYGYGICCWDFNMMK